MCEVVCGGVPSGCGGCARHSRPRTNPIKDPIIQNRNIRGYRVEVKLRDGEIDFESGQSELQEGHLRIPHRHEVGDVGLCGEEWWYGVEEDVAG